MEIGRNLLSGKWTLRILWHVSKDPVRFNELQRLLGSVTTKVLTQQLRELESQGVMKRTDYPDTPPREEYTLTPLGETIQPILKALCNWGSSYQNTISGSEEITRD